MLEVLDVYGPGDRAGRLVNTGLIILIVLNVGANIPGSVASVFQDFRSTYWQFEYFSVAVFSVKYVSRVWTCVESPDPRCRHNCDKSISD